MSQFIPRLKDFARQFLDVSVGVKLLIGSAIGALGGSTFIGFISEYATYNFAFYHGARLPVEGVPYLKLAVTLVSLAIFGGSLFLFGVMYWMLQKLLNITVRYAQVLPWVKEEDLPLENLPLRRYLIVVFPAVLIATLPMAVALINIVASQLMDRQGSISGWVMLASYLVFAVLLVALARKPKGVKWFVTGLSLLLVVGVSASLFSPVVYGGFLRKIRFGGGIEVSIHRSCEGLDDCRSLDSGYLFLRTGEAAILFSRDLSVYREVPVGQIRSYEYKPNPDWRLPEVIQSTSSRPTRTLHRTPDAPTRAGHR